MNYTIVHYGLMDGVPCVIVIGDGRFWYMHMFTLSDCKSQAALIAAINHAVIECKNCYNDWIGYTLPDFNTLGIPVSGTI